MLTLGHCHLQGRAETQFMAGQGRAGQGRAGQGRAGQGRGTTQGRAGTQFGPGAQPSMRCVTSLSKA